MKEGYILEKALYSTFYIGLLGGLISGGDTIYESRRVSKLAAEVYPYPFSQSDYFQAKDLVKLSENPELFPDLKPSQSYQNAQIIFEHKREVDKERINWTYDAYSQKPDWFVKPEDGIALPLNQTRLAGLGASIAIISLISSCGVGLYKIFNRITHKTPQPTS